MGKQVSEGTCHVCDGTFNKAGMTEHLTTCLKKQAGPRRASADDDRPVRHVFHIVVEGSYNPAYWMHLEMPADTLLEELDDFLRNIWLECCGHGSMFMIGGKAYGGGWEDEAGMDVPLEQVVGRRSKFEYEYDFGSTTKLTLKVVAERAVGKQEGGITILARNRPPDIRCESCGKPATQVCTECLWSEKGWLCDHCAEQHECGEEMLLPVVNSPRVGVCGYAGPEGGTKLWKDEEEDDFGAEA